MDDMTKSLIFLGIACVLAWMYYSIYISSTSKTGFIDSDQVSYVKGNATIVGKQSSPSGCELHFTYPDDSNANQGVLIVSQNEFAHAKIGDKIPIFYSIHFPHLWLPITKGKVFYSGIVLVIATILLFTIGGYHLYRFIRA